MKKMNDVVRFIDARLIEIKGKDLMIVRVDDMRNALLDIRNMITEKARDN